MYIIYPYVNMNAKYCSSSMNRTSNEPHINMFIIQYYIIDSPQTTCHRHCSPRAVYKHPPVQALKKPPLGKQETLAQYWVGVSCLLVCPVSRHIWSLCEHGVHAVWPTLSRLLDLFQTSINICVHLYLHLLACFGSLQPRLYIVHDYVCIFMSTIISFIINLIIMIAKYLIDAISCNDYLHFIDRA